MSMLAILAYRFDTMNQIILNEYEYILQTDPNMELYKS